MDEATIRRVVREEIQAAFALVADSADRFPGYETDRMDDAAAYVVKQIVESTTETMAHDPACESRTQPWGMCSCGRYSA